MGCITIILQNKDTKKPVRVKCNLIRLAFSLFLVFSFIALAGNLLNLTSDTAYSNSKDCDVVIVMPGDSLWSIAKQYTGENDDIRRVVDDIMKQNHMTSSNLEIAQQLEIPSRYRKQMNPS